MWQNVQRGPENRVGGRLAREPASLTSTGTMMATTMINGEYVYGTTTNRDLRHMCLVGIVAGL